MAGKTKNEGGKDASKKKQQIDEYQLRKEIREVMKMGDNTSQEQNAVRLNEDNEAISKYTEDYRIGGVEGGGTHSMLIIIDGRGRKLTEVQGSHTNHWALGMEETAARINAMIDKGKEELGMKRPLDCVGLSLSGCEEESTNVLLKQKLLENHPEASKDYVISSDTLGSLRTAVERGGIVLIAGTGSNALLITPDGETHGCGGWGYMMGDEGSAYWIAARLCKYVFDDMDGFSKAPYSIDWVWSAIKDHFGIKTRQEMLPHLYTNFDKSNIAQFAKQVVVGCEKGDELCKFVFEEAGRALAKHVEALSTKTGNDMKLASGGLKVICVGSVWKSWRFLKNGFVNQIHEGGLIDELSLLRLTTSSAIGACYLAAEKLNCSLIKTYEKNAETFFHYNRQNYPKANANDSGDCSSEK